MPTSICSFIAAKSTMPTTTAPASIALVYKCDVCHKICRVVQAANLTTDCKGVKWCYECFEDFVVKKDAETMARLKAEHYAAGKYAPQCEICGQIDCDIEQNDEGPLKCAACVLAEEEEN